LHGVELTCGTRRDEVFAAASSHLLADSFHRRVVNFFDGTLRGDVDDLLTVVINQWHGLIAIDRHAGTNGLFVVICTAAGKHTLNDDVIRYLEVQYTIKNLVLLSKQVFENLCLLNGAWEAIEQKAVCGIVMRHTVFNHAYGDVGRFELAIITVALSLNITLGASTDDIAEEL